MTGELGYVTVGGDSAVGDEAGDVVDFGCKHRSEEAGRCLVSAGGVRMEAGFGNSP